MEKIVFITGISGGMGSATALEFKSKGYRVFGTDFAENGNSFVEKFFQGNVSDETMWESISDYFEKNGLWIDTLVNIAGRNYFSRIEESDLSQWKLMFETNLFGMVLSIKHLLKFLKKSESFAFCSRTDPHGRKALPRR